MRPELALISAVVAAAVALSALILALAVQRSARGLRRRLRSGAAQSEAAAVRVTRSLVEIRGELNRAQGSVALAAAQLEGIDARIETWTAGLAGARAGALELNKRRLVPVTRLIRGVEIALKMAGLWRNPFG